jgi:hypothetical protein
VIGFYIPAERDEDASERAHSGIVSASSWVSGASRRTCPSEVSMNSALRKVGVPPCRARSLRLQAGPARSGRAPCFEDRDWSPARHLALEGCR